MKRLVAFAATGLGIDTDLYVVPADGGAATRLTDGPAVDSWPSWSPDGSRILFERDGDASSDGCDRVAR